MSSLPKLHPPDPVAVAAPDHGCAGCSLEPMCGGMAAQLSASHHCLVTRRLQLRRGEQLFHMYEAVRDHLFLVRSGYLKQYQVDPDGQQRIIDFPSRDGWIGLDAIDQGHQHACAVALTDCELDAIPYHRLSALLARRPQSAELFGHILSQEVGRQQVLAHMLRSASAQQRVALFLLHLSQAAGASCASAPLPMSRQDIGDYLGLTPATVSRVLSGFKKRGWLVNRQRALTLLAPERIRQTAAGIPVP